MGERGVKINKSKTPTVLLSSNEADFFGGWLVSSAVHEDNPPRGRNSSSIVSRKPYGSTTPTRGGGHGISSEGGAFVRNLSSLLSSDII